MAKPVKDNLTGEQRISLKEIKDNKIISIYPYDKGASLVRIMTEDGIKKIKEQIGDTQIIINNSSGSLARDIRKELSILNKNN